MHSELEKIKESRLLSLSSQLQRCAIKDGGWKVIEQCERKQLYESCDVWSTFFYFAASCVSIVNAVDTMSSLDMLGSINQVARYNSSVSTFGRVVRDGWRFVWADDDGCCCNNWPVMVRSALLGVD